jgi:hypothetical protein
MVKLIWRYAALIIFIFSICVTLRVWKEIKERFIFFQCKDFSYLCYYLFLNVYLFCDVCLVGLSFMVGIFSHPSHFLTPSPFHPYSPYPFNSHMGPFWFIFLFHTLHVSLLSPPLCPLQVLVWCLLGALLVCVGDCVL